MPNDKDLGFEKVDLKSLIIIFNLVIIVFILKGKKAGCKSLEIEVLLSLCNSKEILPSLVILITK